MQNSSHSQKLNKNKWVCCHVAGLELLVNIWRKWWGRQEVGLGAKAAETSISFDRQRKSLTDLWVTSSPVSPLWSPRQPWGNLGVLYPHLPSTLEALHHLKSPWPDPGMGAQRLWAQGSAGSTSAELMQGRPFPGMRWPNPPCPWCFSLLPLCFSKLWRACL